MLLRLLTVVWGPIARQGTGWGGPRQAGRVGTRAPLAMEGAPISTRPPTFHTGAIATHGRRHPSKGPACENLGRGARACAARTHTCHAGRLPAFADGLFRLWGARSHGGCGKLLDQEGPELDTC